MASISSTRNENDTASTSDTHNKKEMASSSSPHTPTENDVEWIWDEEYECFRVGDVFHPQPIREYFPPEAVVVAAAAAAPPPAATGGRTLSRSESLNTKTYFFQLFRCEEMDKFILAMIQVETGDTTYYVLTPTIEIGKKKIKTKETLLGQMVLSPVVGEIYPNDLSNRSDLPIEQRLGGQWEVELRVRKQSMKMELFYRRKGPGVRKTFRSMHEVATFIAYNAYY